MVNVTVGVVEGVCVSVDALRVHKSWLNTVGRDESSDLAVVVPVAVVVEAGGLVELFARVLE